MHPSSHSRSAHSRISDRSLQTLTRGLASIADHVMITDSGGHILYANAAVERASGFPLREVIGKNPAELWGGHMSQSFYERMWRTIKTKKKPFRGEVRNVRKDGEEIWQELRISPILDREGRVRFFIGIEPDITARHAHEHFYSEFLSVVGHESLSPLTAVRWILELLETQGKLNRNQRKSVQEVYRQNARVIAMIESLLLLAERGKGYPEKSSFDLALELRQVLSLVRADHPLVRFAVRGETSALPLRDMRSLTHTLLHSLLTCAIPAMTPKGGEITVGIAKKPTAIMVSVTASPLDRKKKWDDLLPRLIVRSLRWGRLMKKVEGEAVRYSVRIPLRRIRENRMRSISREQQ